jgi:hypothetical protein
MLLLLVIFFINSQDSSDHMKPSTADLSKKLFQRASSSHATPVAPLVGVIDSITLSAAEVWDYCRRAAEILEGLKNREADQEGNHLLLHYFFLSISLADLQPSYLQC